MLRTIKKFLATIVRMTRTRLSESKDDLAGQSLNTAVRNVRNGIRNCRPEAVASTLLARYQDCFLLHADHWWDHPRIERAEYRKYAAYGSVPLVRVKKSAVERLTEGRGTAFGRVCGVTLALGIHPCRPSTGKEIIADIESSGWRVLTVDDARCILNERANTLNYYWTKRGWLSDVEEVADRTKIAGRLLPICEQVVSARVAVMVIYTPVLWGYFRLWRRSLKGTMPALLPIK